MSDPAKNEPPEPEKGDGEEQYKVGYQKPPKQSQFKKGNKAGKGRPKGSKNLKMIVNAAADEKVPVKINGKVRKLARKELAVRQLANKASAGDLKAIDKLITLLEIYGPQEDLGEISKEQADYDLETIIHHLKMRGLIEFDDPDKGDNGDE